MQFSKVIKVIFRISFLLLFASIFSACTHQQDESPNPSEDVEKQNDPPAPQPVKAWKLPIEIPEGEFYKIGGWLTDQEILYITNYEQSSSLYVYHLLTGISELLYKSDAPIASVQISPSKELILIQSSPSTYEGQVIIVTPNGSEIIKKSIPSYELEFEWNQFNESEILISSFNEDWTFQMLLLDIEQNKTSELSIPQPFIKWLGIEEVAFLHWDEASPSLFAPLKSEHLGTDKQETILDDVLQFSTYRNTLMAVTVSDEEKLQAAYTFYNKENKEVYTFSIPHLTMFSGWLVPFYDFNESKGKFITLKPLKSAEADAYSGGFDLVSYDIIKDKSDIILEALKNEPLLLSPAGEAALYGNRFDQIIDLHTKVIYKLVKK